MKLTREFFFAIAPAARPEYVDDMVRWQAMLISYGITSVSDICHFFGQCAAETSGFTKLEESLYYTTVKRIRQVWPSRFKSDAAAAPYVRNPQKLANFTYGGRLGNTAPNDGWLFRGSGMPHLTGRANYQGMHDRTGVECVKQPDLIRAMPAALEAACDFWRANKLARFVGDVKRLTKAWQGGDGGLVDRATYTARALKAATALIPGAPGPDYEPVKPIPAAKLIGVGRANDPNDVRFIQTRLKALGYTDVGRVDGSFGDATERAVKDFQRDNGLVSDGIVGPSTLARLNTATGRAKVPPAAEGPSGLDRFITWLISLFNPR